MTKGNLTIWVSKEAINMGDNDLKHIVFHEILHTVFGASHNDRKDRIMNPEMQDITDEQIEKQFIEVANTKGYANTMDKQNVISTDTFESLKKELGKNIEIVKDYKSNYQQRLSLLDVEREAEPFIEIVKERKKMVNEALTSKRRLLRIGKDMNPDDEIKKIINDTNKEMDKLKKERQEINKFIKWADKTDNLMSYLPKFNIDDYMD